PVGGARQCQDRLAHVGVTFQGGAAVGRATAYGAVGPGQVVDLAAHLVGDALGGHTELFDERTKCPETVGDRGVVPFDLHEFGHGHPRHGVALTGFPVTNGAVGCGHRVGGVVGQRHGHHVPTCPQVVGGQLTESAGKSVEGVEVGT